MTQPADTYTTPAISLTSSVPEGRVADFLTGKHVRDTREEYVRQNIEQALVRQYGYDPSDCAPEFRIKVGSSRKYVDIAVFYEGTSHDQENVRILVETKQSGTSPVSRTEGIAQLQSYMAACLNAQYGLWTNGDERYCFAKRIDGRGRFTFDEIIDIPARGQTEADAQRPTRRSLKPATADNLLFAFRRCHNYIAGTEGKQKPDAFWELLKLIFCKIEDERSRVLDFFVTPGERGSATAAASAKARLQRLFVEKVVRKYPSIFHGSDEIDLKPNVVAYVVSQLQNFSLLASPVDVKGVAYEEIVGSNLRGDRGEFFTPRNACRMAVTMLNPQPGERLIDPACGTGGFLIIAMNNALDHIEGQERAEWGDPSRGSDSERQELYRRRSEYLSECVIGLDLNPSLVRAAKMNMVMNNDGSGGLYQANSLANPHSWEVKLAAAVQLSNFDVVVTNPPFGANIIVDSVEVLSQFDLAAVWDQTDDGVWEMRRQADGMPVLQRSQPPEILFVERCVQLLQPGTGRMAIVLPNGILNNPALGYVRQWIMANTQLLAVVDMARELFQPKNDTQTSMVLLRRFSDEERHRAATAKVDYPVFMAVAERVGHDRRGNVIFRRTPTGEDVLSAREESILDVDPDTGEEVFRTVTVRERLIDDELPDVAGSYLRWQVEHR
jgi:type I restriction enzyme M protein